MPFQPLAVVEQDAPAHISRRELDDYKAHLLTLAPGKQHLIWVEKGEPAVRKVKALDEKGQPMTRLDDSTGKLVPLYATIKDGQPSDPQPSGLEDVEYVYEETGRGKSEQKDAAGLMAAGAELNMNVRITEKQYGHGDIRQNQAGVFEFVPNEGASEKTCLTLVRSNPRNDTPEGKLKKEANLADTRMKKTQEQLNRAKNASESYKAELQEKIDNYKTESETKREQLKQIENATTTEAKEKLYVKFGFRPAVDESNGQPEQQEAPAKKAAPAKAAAPRR